MKIPKTSRSMEVPFVKGVASPTEVGGTATSDNNAVPTRACKRRVGLCLAILLLVGCVILSIVFGAKLIPPADVWTIVVLGPQHDRTALPSGISPENYGIVWDLRIPRTALAVFVGASLAIAGTLTQSWTRNPLADPGIIGINAGAGCAIAVGLTLGFAGSILERAVWGLAGALLAAIVVLWISRVSRDSLTLVLVGVGVTFALQGVMNLLSLYSSDTLDGLRRWSVGSTAGRGSDEVWLALAGFVIGGALAATAARSLDIFAMGEDTARSLGGSPNRARWLAAAAVVVLAGTATASVGLLLFLGFAVPHMVRPWTGSTVSRMIIPVAIVGSTVTLVADLVGRFAMQPNELDMGIVIALVGAPLMIVVVRSQAGKKLHG